LTAFDNQVWGIGRHFRPWQHIVLLNLLLLLLLYAWKQRGDCI
jgi:hypothetical protein